MTDKEYLMDKQGLAQDPDFQAWIKETKKPFNIETDLQPKYSNILQIDGQPYTIDEGDYLDFLLAMVKETTEKLFGNDE